MNKIASMFIAVVMASMIIMPSINTAKAQQSAEIAPTQEELQLQYQGLINQLITLLKVKIAELQAQIETMKKQEAEKIQPIQAEVTAPTPVSASPETVLQPSETVQAPVEDAFSFEYEIAGRKDNSIKLPSAPYTKADYWVKYKVFNKNGNPFTVNTTGFNEGEGGAQVSFMQKFLEKQVYTMTITATDSVTGAQSSLIMSVDTR